MDKDDLDSKPKGGQTTQEAILDALKGAGGGLRFTQLLESCQEIVSKLTKSNFSYHLGRLQERGIVRWSESTGLYQLVPRTANTADVEFWLDKVKTTHEAEARRVAFEQFGQICRSRIIDRDVLNNAVIPIMRKALADPDVEIVESSLGILRSIMLNLADDTATEERQAICQSIRSLVANTGVRLNLRRLGASTITELAKTEDDYEHLTTLMGGLIRESELNYEEVGKVMIDGLENSPPSVRAKVRAWVFDLVSHKNPAVEDRAKSLIRRFGEAGG